MCLLAVPAGQETLGTCRLGFAKFELGMEDKSLLLDTSRCASEQGVAPVFFAFGMPAQ